MLVRNGSASGSAAVQPHRSSTRFQARCTWQAEGTDSPNRESNDALPVNLSELEPVS